MKNFYYQRNRFSCGPNRYFELVSRPRIIREIKAVIFSLHIQGKINYLDLGCGNCRVTKLFADLLSQTSGRSVKTVGVDLAPSCENSEISTKNLDLNYQKIPFSNHFHIITLFDTIEHIFDTDFMLESANNSLVKGGILVVITLNVVCWKNRIMVPLGIQPMNTEVSTKKSTYGYKFSFLKKYVSRNKPSGHIRPFTIDSLGELLEDNGFKVVYKFGIENWRAMKYIESLAKSLCTSIGLIGVKK